MRILHIITTLKIGGAEKLMVDLLPRLRDRGNDVDLLVIDGVRTSFYEKLEHSGINIYSLGENNKMYSLKNLVKLFAFLRKGNYDIVHTHNTAPQLFAAISKCASHSILCTTEHNTSNRRRHWKGYRIIDRWMYRQYEGIICISDQAEINLRTYLGNEILNIVTIYNGIDVTRFEKALPNAKLQNEKNGRCVIVMVAGFRKQKDQDTLINAMTYLSKEQFEVWLVGDGERRSNLESLVKENRLEDNVKFLGLRNDVPEVLKAADIVVMSSHYEGLSLSNLEGMAAGKPFIASDVDGLREIVKGNGLLFRHGDAKELADLILSVDANKELKYEVVDRCFMKAKQYDIEIMADKYCAFYSKITDGYRQ